MSTIRFTNEQQKAIDIKNKDILVSAAAGSGKTAVLVARVIDRILDKKNPIDINRMLIVTYTNAAASEMKKRIFEALEKASQHDPNNQQIRRQLRLLPRAHISTMSSFCLSIAKDYFYAINIEPNFRPTDTAETDIVEEEVLDNLFELWYEEKNPSFIYMLEYFEHGIGDDTLKKALIEGNKDIRRHPWPKLWLKEQEELLFIQDEKDLIQTSWFQFIYTSLLEDLNNIIEHSQQLAKEVEEAGISHEFHEIFVDDLEKITKMYELLKNNPLDEYISYALTLKYRNMRRPKTEEPVENELIESFIRRRNDLKADAMAVKLTFPSDTKTMLAHLRGAFTYTQSFHTLLLLFHDAFQEKKRELQIADFSDLEHFALQVLLKPGSTKENLMPTEEALVIRSLFNEIYIDEYQDINMLQELILLTISTSSVDKPNRFMVGDIKQSIYRFRLANPEIFNEKYQTYPKINMTDIATKNEVTIELSKNFRSRIGVLSAINDVFYQILSSEVGEIEYTEDVALHPGKTFIETDEKKASLYLIEKNGMEEGMEEESLQELTKSQIEAAFIASKIEELIKSHFLIEENGDQRPIEYRDIVVLFRSPKKRADLVEQELANRSIPAYNYNQEGYFEKTEVMTILSLLKIIDNPRQDIPLVSVLYSPIAFFDADELYLIAQQKEDNFYDNMKIYVDLHTDELSDKIIAFLTLLEKYQEKALHTPIHALLWYLYQDTGYYDLVGSLPGGTLRQGNLLALYEHALLFEESNFSGLFHFVTFIETLEKEDKDLSEAKILSKDENVVKLMSIHKSKGLEFPVVFVANIEKRFYLPELSGSMLSHQTYGFGFENYDSDVRVYSETIHRTAIKEALRLEAISEELRILYVAMTRAQEKVILTGVIEDIEKIKEENKYLIHRENIGLPTITTKKGRSFLDYILWSLTRHDDGYLLRDEPLKRKLPFTSTWHIEKITPKEVFRTGYEKKRYQSMFLHHLLEGEKTTPSKEMIETLSFEYPNIEATKLPSTISISEINRRFSDELLPESMPIIQNAQPHTFFYPSWEKKKADSLTKGHLLHTVLEHIDFKNLHEFSIEKTIETLLNKHIITEDEKEWIPLHDIETFLSHPLLTKITNSKQILKEWPFVMHLPSHILSAYSQEGILLHGIIDLLFFEEDELIVLDYKTDKVYPDIKHILDRHRLQLSIYKKAVEDSMQIKVKKCLLYLFDIHEIVEMDTLDL